MGIVDDFSRFLETRLDEFLKANPHLELQALQEQLREQEKDTLRGILDLQRQEQKLKDDILAIASDIQRWHARIAKAEAANRPDLARIAREKETELLRQGNQLWGQAEGVKARLTRAKELLGEIERRQQEVKAKMAQAKTARQTREPASKAAWERGANWKNRPAVDPLETQFQQWEVEQELEQMKRQNP